MRGTGAKMTDLDRAYRFFRKHAGGIVGRSAQTAMLLARAEHEAQERGWEVCLQPEDESYRDVYGDDPPEGAEFVCVALLDEDGEWLGSLGFVDANDDDYIRVTGAELALEALSQERKAELRKEGDSAYVD
jgi:hypothetical protein